MCLICTCVVTDGLTEAPCRAHVDLASVEVRFQDLSVNAEVAVGARGEPNVLNFYRNMLDVGLRLRTTTHVHPQPMATSLSPAHCCTPGLCVYPMHSGTSSRS